MSFEIELELTLYFQAPMYFILFINYELVVIIRCEIKIKQL